MRGMYVYIVKYAAIGLTSVVCNACVISEACVYGKQNMYIWNAKHVCMYYGVQGSKCSKVCAIQACKCMVCAIKVCKCSMVCTT